MNEFIWKEDEVGRFRERVIKGIEEFGVKNWFEKMGYPTADDSVWINRNTKHKTTLGEQVNKYGNFKGFEEQGYYLWENWLPEKLWNDKAESELMSAYRVGTKEHNDRLLQEEKDRKKYAKKDKDKPLLRKGIVKCKVTESGFDVVNTDDFKELNTHKGLLSHSPNRETNKDIGVTKEEFEKAVKEDYNAESVEWIYPIIEVTPEQIKGYNPFEEDYRGNKKVIVKVKYGLDSKDERDFFITDNRSEVGIESYMGGCGSSAFGSKIGQAEKTLIEKEQEALEWVIKGILEDGVARENISIVREEMNEEDMNKHNAWKEERRKTDLKNAEKDIEEYSKKLKNALKIKFGFEVTLKVEKKI